MKNDDGIKQDVVLAEDEQDGGLDFGPLAFTTMDHPEPASGGQRLQAASVTELVKDWFLICPPKNWQDAEPIDLGELRLLELVAERLDLVVTRDDKRKKIYLGTELGESDIPGNSSEEVSENPSPGTVSKSLEQDPETPISGLRFGNGWTADIVSDDEAGSQYEAVDSLAAAPLVHAFPDHQVSKNFRLSEFRPGEHSYNLIRIHPDLIMTLEDIREKAGSQTIHVTSGYRPPAYNRKVGGVGNSTHIASDSVTAPVGLAADIYTDHLSTEALWDICGRVIGDSGGVGFYPTQGFVHVDIRGYGARW